MRKALCVIVYLLCAGWSSRAQFSVNGNESTATQWSTFSTDCYQFIYPEGHDSLAVTYAREWEKYRRSVGYYGNIYLLPVVLHPYSSTSNGFVVWTPSRMEMYAAPSMYSPEPMPWHTMLAIHENRHVAQMQFLYKPPFKYFNDIFGELLAGPFCLLYSSSMFMEGDAVATETALSTSGRGRSADFLEYFRASFEEGDLRDFDKWRYGSQKRYTPDYYKIGYLSVAGMDIGPHSETFDNTLRPRFKAFAEGLQKDWQEDTDSRGPFQSYEQLTENQKYYTSYSGLTVWNGELYAVQTGIAENARLVSFDLQNFRKKNHRHTSADSPLAAGADRLYWTEEIPNLRWEMHSTSELRSYDGRRIVSELAGKRLYNPAIDGDRIALVENFFSGANAVEVYLAGESIASYTAPDGIQAVEPVWVNGHLYASAITEAGQGIYDVEAGFSEVLSPSPVKINHLRADVGRICFTSDRTGVNEFYSLDPSSGEVCQLTNLPRGGKDFIFSGDSLYFTVLSAGGRNICRAVRDSLPVRKVDFARRHKYELADSLTLKNTYAAPDLTPVSISDPEPYDKARNAFKFHSFVPLYLDSDDLMSSSYEDVFGSAGLGATAYFQNNLSTLYGDVAVTGTKIGDKIRPLGRVNLKYRGLYPIIEFDGKMVFQSPFASNSTYARLRTYIPFNLSRNGWSTAVLPIAGITSQYQNTGTSADSRINVWTAGLRAYTMLPTPSSAVYPRAGIGLSAGMNLYDVAMSAENANYFEGYIGCPYATLYGYLPGFEKTHSWAWSVSWSTTPTLTVASLKTQTLSASLRYSMPVFPVDWSGLSPMVYVRNFELIPFYEFTAIRADVQTVSHTFGAYAQAVLGNIFFIPYDFRVGVKAGYDTFTKGPVCNLVFSYDL